MKKKLFVTGTRADYGKLKSLIQIVQKSKKFEWYVFVTGMHTLKKYGSTFIQLKKDMIKNIFKFFIIFGINIFRFLASLRVGNIIESSKFFSILFTLLYFFKDCLYIIFLIQL